MLGENGNRIAHRCSDVICEGTTFSYYSGFVECKTRIYNSIYLFVDFYHFSLFSKKDLINMFLSTVKQVKLEVRPLFLPQLVQLTSLLKPGLHRIRV